MTLKELKNLGRLLTTFLAMFADCFVNAAGKRLLAVYVKGQLSDLQRKNCGSLAESVGEIAGDLGVGATRSGHTNKGSRCSSSALGPSVAIRSARSSLRRGERPTAGSDEGS
jgi:hypothetical protein